MLICAAKENNRNYYLSLAPAIRTASRMGLSMSAKSVLKKVFKMVEIVFPISSVFLSIFSYIKQQKEENRLLAGSGD